MTKEEMLTNFHQNTANYERVYEEHCLRLGIKDSDVLICVKSFAIGLATGWLRESPEELKINLSKS